MTDGFDIRRAAFGDAEAIARVHVEGWRSTYPGILPDRVLLGLSEPRIAAQYGASIRRGRTVHVAVAPDGQVVGFSTASRCRGRSCPAEGEIETLYVLDDWRDHGIGRALLGSVAADLVRDRCASMFVQVLSDNPSRWFYRRLGAVEAATSTVRVGGVDIARTAMVWRKLEAIPALDPQGKDGQAT